MKTLATTLARTVQLPEAVCAAENPGQTNAINLSWYSATLFFFLNEEDRSSETKLAVSPTSETSHKDAFDHLIRLGERAF